MNPIDRLAALLARLPGIGEKTGLRLALALVRFDQEYLSALGDAIATARSSTRECAVCCDLSASTLCPLCVDTRRDHSMVCVVAQPQDRMAIERTGVFRGRYHVLHGLLNPMGGVGPNDLRVRELLERLRDSAVTEVVVATSPTVEGDATALYLGRMLSHVEVKVTRIATGVAVGGELEYADVGSLSAALDQRRPI